MDAIGCYVFSRLLRKENCNGMYLMRNSVNAESGKVREHVSTQRAVRNWLCRFCQFGTKEGVVTIECIMIRYVSISIFFTCMCVLCALIPCSLKFL